MIRQRDFVLRRYSPMFAPEAVGRIGAEEFVEFLQFENNKHWWGLHRDADSLTRNMDVLRWALGVLVDPDVDLAHRIDEIDPPRGPKPILGFEPAVYTAVLLMSDPTAYGVWSGISEAAMRRLDLWPDVPDDESRGTVYAAVNEMLLLTAASIETDLWTLDALFWGVEKEHDPTRHFKRRVQASPTPRRSVAAKTPAAKKPAKATTFLCDTCFQQKMMNLQSDTPGRCVDCA